jgi:hypothetical protein
MGKERWWSKFTFEAEVIEAATADGVETVGLETDRVSAKIVLDHKEHQAWTWASEDDVKNARAGEMKLAFVTTTQQLIMLDAFAQRRRRSTAARAKEAEFVD